MFLVRIFEVIYALYPAHASANIHKIKMEKSKLRDFFLQKKTSRAFWENILTFLLKHRDVLVKTSGVI